jgi:hypothetical protein
MYQIPCPISLGKVVNPEILAKSEALYDIP